MRQVLSRHFFFGLFNIYISFKAKLTYRAATILKLCTNIFTSLVYVYLWLALYGAENSINGFTREEMIIYIILLRILRMLYPFHISGAYGNMIKRGSIYSWLLKPVCVEIHLLTHSVALLLYNFCFCAIPLIAIMSAFADIRGIITYDLLLAFLWFASAFLFIFLLELCIGVVSYYTTNLWGVGQFKNAIVAFFAGELLPLSFYPNALLSFIQVLPFYSIYFIPISFILGKKIESVPEQFIILWVSIILLLVVYLLLSKKMQKSIMIQGG